MSFGLRAHSEKCGFATRDIYIDYVGGQLKRRVLKDSSVTINWRGYVLHLLPTPIYPPPTPSSLTQKTNGRLTSQLVIIINIMLNNVYIYHGI